MPRTVLLAALSCLALACFHLGAAAQDAVAQAGPGKTTRPNILWIIAEDFGPELGCYGEPEVWTPHIDALAERGMRFTHAFATAPVCSASRSAFMTGMYQTTIGAHNHRSHRDDGYGLPEGVRLLTDWLRDAGYFTANIRHLSDDRQEKFYRGTGKTDWNFHVEGRPFDTDQWTDLKQHQPFYAQINFSETHRGAAWDNAHKVIERTADPAKVVLPPYYPDHPVARQDWAQYLNSAMALDLKVGRVLEHLERDGLADNTVVFFFADHGRAMVRGKQWCYDSGLQIPFVLYWPKGIPAPPQYRAGTVSDQLIASIDITATSLALSGSDKPAKMQGRVFLQPPGGGSANVVDPPREYVFGARDRCDETVFRIRTARDARYRYIRNFDPERPFLQINRYKESSYPMLPLMRELHAERKLTAVQEVLFAPSRPPEELYDLAEDPYEIHNLATGETGPHRQVLTRMRAAVEQWIADSNDQGRTPEDPAIVEGWEARAKASWDARRKRP